MNQRSPIGLGDRRECLPASPRSISSGGMEPGLGETLERYPSNARVGLGIFRNDLLFRGIFINWLIILKPKMAESKLSELTSVKTLHSEYLAHESSSSE